MTLTDTLEGTSSGALAKHKINLHIADDTKSTEPPTGKRPGLFGWGQSHQKTLPGGGGWVITGKLGVVVRPDVLLLRRLRQEDCEF